MECRPKCGACCIAPSISSAIPGMPDGKPAGIACIHLREDCSCKLFGKPERPQVCNQLPPSEDICGASREQALQLLSTMEALTR
ncbi:YkgJ family cysteine cluster protein [Kaarinaea lacus]